MYDVKLNFLFLKVSSGISPMVSLLLVLVLMPSHSTVSDSLQPHGL